MEKITFFGALGRMWGRIFNYKDTASRKEYWFPFIFHFIIAVLAAGLMYLSLTMESGNLYYCLGAFALLGYLSFSVIPWISLTVRRLRDTGKSGWWTLLILVVGIGSLILMLLCTSASAIYNTGGSFNPVNNEAVAVYGPPEMFDPSLNELEDVYGPPDMLDPSYNQDELNDEPIVDPDEVKEESTEAFDEKANMEALVYGPPEMLNASNESEGRTEDTAEEEVKEEAEEKSEDTAEEKTETKAATAEVEGQITLDDLANQEEK